MSIRISKSRMQISFPVISLRGSSFANVSNLFQIVFQTEVRRECTKEQAASYQKKMSEM